MLQILIKALIALLLFYALWIFTGGVERGEQRRAAGTDSIFIGVQGTALDSENASTSNSLFEN